MFARATVRLNAAAVPQPDRHARINSEFEGAEIVGEGTTWEAAKAACVVPDGALITAIRGRK